MKHLLVAVGLLGLAGVPGDLYAQVPVSSQEVKNVNATADVTVNATLPPPPPTFRLSGTLSGAAAFFLLVSAQSTDGLSGFSGNVDPITNKYLILVPAGTYKLTVSFIGSFSGTPTISTFQDPAPVQVTADTVRDITVMPVATYNLSGTISGLDSRFPSTFLAFVPTDPTSGLFAASPAKINADGTYSARVSDGSYSAFMALSTTDASRTTGLGLGSVTVSGADVSANFTVPPLANLSGTVQTADKSPVMMGSSVFGVDGDLLALRSTTGIPVFSYSSGTIDSASGSYQIVLATGHTYSIGVTLKLLPEAPPQSSGDFFLVAASNTQISGDTTQDIAVPQPPGTVTISGQVKDSAGAAVANAAVSASTAEVTGIATGGFSRGTQTDSSGNYSLVVLSGTNYGLIFSPPANTNSLLTQVRHARGR